MQAKGSVNSNVLLAHRHQGQAPDLQGADRMSIPTTENVRQGMSVDEFERFSRIGRALNGMPADRAVALLMSVICEVIDQDHLTARADLWRSIASGARKEIELTNRKRGRLT